jgi:hypothetical protein
MQHKMNNNLLFIFLMLISASTCIQQNLLLQFIQMPLRVFVDLNKNKKLI